MRRREMGDRSRDCRSSASPRTGGQGGGYATLRALTQRPDLITPAAWTASAPADIATLFKSFPRIGTAFSPAGGAASATSGATTRSTRAISPLYHVDAIRAPLLIGQGKNDPRVKVAQADAMVKSAARRRPQRDRTSSTRTRATASRGLRTTSTSSGRVRGVSSLSTSRAARSRGGRSTAARRKCCEGWLSRGAGGLPLTATTPTPCSITSDRRAHRQNRRTEARQSSESNGQADRTAPADSRPAMQCGLRERWRAWSHGPRVKRMMCVAFEEEAREVAIGLGSGAPGKWLTNPSDLHGLIPRDL